MDSKKITSALLDGLKKTNNKTVAVLAEQVKATGKAGADLVAAANPPGKYVSLDRMKLIEAIEGKKPAAV